MSLAEDLHYDLSQFLDDTDFDDREELDEALHEFLEEDLIGIFGASKRMVEGALYFDVLEFTLKDGSSIVVAEDCEGGIRFFSMGVAPQHVRH